jgi:hypothetical protein
MPSYNPKNERIKKEYFRFLKEADRKADTTIDGVRKTISRFEVYTGYKDLATFNKRNIWQRASASALDSHSPSQRSSRQQVGSKTSCGGSAISQATKPNSN